MIAIDALYRDTILDHHRAPRGRQPLPRVDAEFHGHNPVCGDETTVQLALDGEVIAGIAVHGHGCAIATASGSILAELLEGKTVGEAQELVHAFRELLAGQETVDETQLGDLIALAGVRQFPVRIKCAALPWDTLTRALDQAVDKAM